MSNFFITGFDTTMGDTINYVDLGQVFMDNANNQNINGFVSYQNNPINRLTFNNPNQFVNKQYVDNSNLASVNNIIFQAISFTPMLTPVNFTNTIEYPTNVLITKSDITFKQNNLYNAPANDQIYTFGAGNRVTGGVAGGGIWVMAGQGTYSLAYSYDGINWYPSSSTVFTNYCSAVAWNGSIWVAMGNSSSAVGGNGLAYSYDGINWVGLGMSVFEATIDFSNIAGSFAWNGIMWVGFGRYTNSTNNFFYSYDGIQWFGNGNGGLTGFINHGGQIAWNGTVFVAATNLQTSNYNLVYSYDGIKWTYVTTWIGGANSAYCNAVAWNGTVWTCPAGYNSASYYSRDGVIWYYSSTNYPNYQNNTTSYATWCIWTGQYFLAVAGGNNYSCFMSYTGIFDWSYVQNSIAANNYAFNMIAYNGSMFVVPTSQNLTSCYYTSTGPLYGWLSASTWPFTTRGNFVAWGGRKENVLYLPQSRMLALGSGVTNSIAYSYDGSANWIGGNVITSWGAGSAGNYYTTTKSMSLFSSGNGAAWDGTKWVAAGTPNTIPTFITPLTVPSSLNFLSNTVAAGNVSYFAPVGNTFFTPSMPGYTNALWTQSAWTIEAWIRIPASSNANGMGIIGSLNTNFAIGTTSSYFLTVPGATASDTQALNDGNWHYVAVTVNSGVTNGSFYYVDGVQKPNAFTSTLVPGNYATNPFCVGTWNTTSYTNNFIGEIAEIRIWNTVISPIQIQTQWQTNVAINSSGLVAYYTNFPITPTTGTISAGTQLANTANGGISLQLSLGGSGGNNVTYDIVNKPTMYIYSGGGGAYSLSPQHTLAYSTIYGNTFLGNAGNVWTGMGNYTFSVSANNIAWNGNVWVGVGQGGNTLAYSPDGFTWFGLGSTVFNGWGNSLAWNGVFWVAVGYGANTLAYSSDGVQWTGLGSNTFSGSCNGVNWNGTMWVATGTGANTLAYSMDAINWTGLGRSTFAIQGNDVASNIQGTMWVAAGQGSTVSGIGNVLAWSGDGINWNKPTGNIWSTQNIFTLAGTSVTHNGRYWIATGIGGNSIAYSPDGNTWTGEGTITNFNYYANRVVWNQGLGSATFKTNYTTTTGLALTANASSQPFWVAAGSPYGTTASGLINGNTLGYSRTGLTWFGLGNTVFYTAGQFVAYNGSRWIAGGVGANTMAYSNNGINWIGLGSNLFSVKGIFAKWNGAIWVAVGQGGSNGNSLAWSVDGINWTGLGNGIFSYGASVEWNGMMWIAGGNNSGYTAYGNTLAYSFNGTNWTGLGGNVFALSCNSISWNGFMWIGNGGSANWTGVASQSTGNTLAYSMNGFNWFGITNNFFNGPGGYGQSLAFNGKIWVASGFSGNAVSANLIVSPAYLGSQPGNTLIYSFNGFNWNMAYGSASIFTNVCYTTKWDGKIFIAGGQSYSTGVGGGNSIAYSYNGNTWVGIGNNVFSGNVFGVACKNLFGNKIQLDNTFVSKTQALEVVSDSVYQAGHTGASVYVNARPFTSAVNPLVINSNFATIIYPTNTANMINNIFGWTLSGQLTGQNTLISSGTGGTYGFLNCPSPQFLILQTIINQPVLLSQSIYINPGTYTLSFYAAPRSNYNIIGYYSPAHQLTVTINNYGIVTNFTANTNPWTLFTFQFTITTADYYVLQFSSLCTTITDSSIGLTEIAIF